MASFLDAPLRSTVYWDQLGSISILAQREKCTLYVSDVARQHVMVRAIFTFLSVVVKFARHVMINTKANLGATSAKYRVQRLKSKRICLFENGFTFLTCLKRLKKLTRDSESLKRLKKFLMPVKYAADVYRKEIDQFMHFQQSNNKR